MAEKRKPYLVDVHLIVQVPVVAESEDEARKVARCYVEDEIDNGMGIEESVDYADVRAPTLQHKEIDMIPWGVCDQDERRDWTIKQWLESV